VRVFRQESTLEIGSHACSLEASMRATNAFPLGCSLLLPVGIGNSIQTLKGDATQGALETMYDGPRPSLSFPGAVNDCHYHGINGTFQPMRKQGAIILGTGGDNSNGAVGNFYEGFMATGVTSAATDVAIQANIVAVGYKI
jgi:hypothetical protein